MKCKGPKLKENNAPRGDPNIITVKTDKTTRQGPELEFQFRG